MFAAFGATTQVFTVTVVWLIAAMVVAVRQALDYTTTTRALAVCLVACLVTIAFAVTLGLLFGPAVAA